MKRLNANRNQKLSLRLKGKEKDNIFTKGTSSAILAVKDIINTKPPKRLKKLEKVMKTFSN